MIPSDPNSPKPNNQYTTPSRHYTTNSTRRTHDNDR